MTLEGSIGKIVPGMMALGVAGESMKLIPKFNKKGKMKPISSKKMIKGFTNIMVGTALIKPVADMTAGL